MSGQTHGGKSWWWSNPSWWKPKGVQTQQSKAMDFESLGGLDTGEEAWGAEQPVQGGYHAGERPRGCGPSWEQV
jgi:hypothetical protein